MRAIKCPCGRRLEGVDEEDLFRQPASTSTAPIPRWTGVTTNCASASPRTHTTWRRSHRVGKE